MDSRLSRRVRGLGFLAGSVVAALLLVYLLLDPSAFADIHPIPLVVLLAVTALVALWQAVVLLR